MDIRSTMSNKKIKRIFQQAAAKEANAVLYMMGRKQPNYPVPAIRYHVDSGRTGVAIWNESVPYSDVDYYTMQPEFELNNPDYL